MNTPNNIIIKEPIKKLAITWYTLSPPGKFNLSLLVFNGIINLLSLAILGLRNFVYTKTVVRH